MDPSLLLALFTLAVPHPTSGPPAVQAAPQATPAGAPALTIYNGDFAVVRELLALELAAGVNEVTAAGMTTSLEPDSVMLRDPSGTRALQVLEQDYRNDPVSQELLLSLFEGRTIPFLVVRDGGEQRVQGRIVRSGFVSGQQGGRPGTVAYSQPIIEVDGELRFGLPGQPLFPSLADDTVLQPTLRWTLATDRAGPLTAELSYLTGGLDWEADYNVVLDARAGTLDLVGWITMVNQSGKVFRDARVKLMAGDVNKVVEDGAAWDGRMIRASAEGRMLGAPVTEKTFDEFHLYTLARSTTLHDQETKQVEFVRGQGVPCKTLYVYDGAAIDPRRWNGWNAAALRSNPDYGSESNPKVAVMREFQNSEASGLGLPLPAGTVRFSTRDADGQLEFVGENRIDHTPKDETLRLYTGNAFDLVGERVRTAFSLDEDDEQLDESFAITLRNHKLQAVEIRVVEHLYRWRNCEVVQPSHEFVRSDSETIEFRVNVPAGGEVTVRYTAHYTW